MESALDHRGARALLEWHIELGADECIQDSPVNRYELPDAAPVSLRKAAVAPSVAGAMPATPVRPQIIAPVQVDAVAEAQHAAGLATDLAGLRAAMEGFAHCDLKRGARNFVFADGKPGARVMIVGEAPGRDEDLAGRPFVGAAGQLLDRMLAAIGLARDADDPGRAVYVTNALPWRPPQNRDPDAAEIAMMRPFLERHVALARPELLIVMGNHPCEALLHRKGIMRLRGTWAEAVGLPVMPMAHPEYLLRTPAAKREAWADLLEVQARLAVTGEQV
jgi:uracil-DNA glycosylase